MVMLNCVKYKSKTTTNNTQNVIIKSKKHLLHGTCAMCGSTKTQFVKDSDLVLSVNSAIKNIKLPWVKFLGEMHLPGMQAPVPI